MTATAAETANLGQLTFTDVAEWLEAKLIGVGVNVPIQPGPNTDRSLQARFPSEAMLALDIGGGPGLDAEGMVDVVGVNVLAIGRSNSYRSCESLALVTDRIIVPNRPDFAGDAPEAVGRSWVLWRVRSGGRPSISEYDAPAAGRWHATGSYLFGVASTP